jgi:ubiquinone/menaquinone biosynthesis C-methylase UbiE
MSVTTSNRVAPRLDSARTQAEAHFWAQVDVDQVRRVAWSSIPCLGTMALLEMTRDKTCDINQLVAETMQAPQRERLRGLVLGCGDMAYEHCAFLNPHLSFAEVDAYDINADAFDQARATTEKAGLKVNYLVGDVNQLTLPANTYHLIVVLHSYHHFTQVERVAQQINRALVAGGVFYTIDYVGPRRLQWTDRQLSYAHLLLEALPERYRREINGQVRQQIRRMPLGALSPDEAIRSDKILSAIQRHLQVVWQYNWAGLLYPLLDGIAFNFDETDPVDRSLIEYLFNIDRVLCQSGRIRPNFTMTLAVKR